MGYINVTLFCHNSWQSLRKPGEIMFRNIEILYAFPPDTWKLMDVRKEEMGFLKSSCVICMLCCMFTEAQVSKQ